MSAITADPTVAKWLTTLSDVTEIYDAQGNLLGTFSPRLTAEEYARYEKIKQHFDPVEMDRLAAEYHGKGRPLAGFWKELEARERAKLESEASDPVIVANGK